MSIWTAGARYFFSFRASFPPYWGVPLIYSLGKRPSAPRRSSFVPDHVVFCAPLISAFNNIWAACISPGTVRSSAAGVEGEEATVGGGYERVSGHVIVCLPSACTRRRRYVVGDPRPRRTPAPRRFNVCQRDGANAAPEKELTVAAGDQGVGSVWATATPTSTPTWTDRVTRGAACWPPSTGGDSGIALWPPS